MASDGSHFSLRIPRDLEVSCGSLEKRDLRGVSIALCLSGALCSTISERHIGCCKRAGKLGDLFCSIIFSRPHITPEWTGPNRPLLRKDSKRLFGLKTPLLFRNESNFLRIQRSYVETAKVGTFEEFKCLTEVYFFTIHCRNSEDNLHRFVGSSTYSIDVSAVKEWLPFMSLFIASSWLCRKVRCRFILY